MSENVQADLRNRIMNYLAVRDNPFKTAVSSRLFYHIAKQGEPLPYSVFDILNTNEERDSASKYTEHLVQFLIGAEDLSTLESITEKLLQEFDDSEELIDMFDYQIITVIKNFQSQPQLIETVWNQIIQYSITIQ